MHVKEQICTNKKIIYLKSYKRSLEIFILFNYYVIEKKMIVKVTDQINYDDH